MSLERWVALRICSAPFLIITYDSRVMRGRFLGHSQDVSSKDLLFRLSPLQLLLDSMGITRPFQQSIAKARTGIRRELETAIQLLVR